MFLIAVTGEPQPGQSQNNENKTKPHVVTFFGPNYKKAKLIFPCSAFAGGIACGKTSVCDVFQRFDIPVINADLISRQSEKSRVKNHDRRSTTFEIALIRINLHF